jgi:formylglycine-generating enzyme required for sulfatase activity
MTKRGWGFLLAGVLISAGCGQEQPKLDGPGPNAVRIQLEPPLNESPKQYQVVTTYDVVRGKSTVKAAVEGASVTVVAALRDGSHAVLLDLAIGDGEHLNAEPRLDLRHTAASLIFLNPFVSVPDARDAAWMYREILAAPETDRVEEALGSVWGVDAPLSDPAVAEAIADVLPQIMDRLVEVARSGGLGQAHQGLAPSFGSDGDSVLEATATVMERGEDRNRWGFQSNRTVDWIVDIAEIDVEGEATSTDASVTDPHVPADAREVRSLDARTLMGTCYPRKTDGIRHIIVVPAKSFEDVATDAAKSLLSPEAKQAVDLSSKMLNESVRSLLDGAVSEIVFGTSPQDIPDNPLLDLAALRFPEKQSALLVARGYSGALDRISENAQRDRTWMKNCGMAAAKTVSYDVRAMAINVIQGALDFALKFVSLKKLLGALPEPFAEDAKAMFDDIVKYTVGAVERILAKADDRASLGAAIMDEVRVIGAKIEEFYHKVVSGKLASMSGLGAAADSVDQARQDVLDSVSNAVDESVKRLAERKSWYSGLFSKVKALADWGWGKVSAVLNVASRIEALIEATPVEADMAAFGDPWHPSADKPEFTSVPGGTFTMGDEGTTTATKRGPAHEVTVAPFQVMRTEVTVAMYRVCVERGACPALLDRWDMSCNLNVSGLSDHPVNCLTYDAAQAYCDSIGARLPSEAEWEYLAKLGNASQYPWGIEAEGCQYANVATANLKACEGSNGTAPVCSHPDGNKTVGGKEICDLAGNVSEWTADDLHTNYEGAPTDGSAWMGGAGADPMQGVLRGGSFKSFASSARNTSREFARKDSELPYHGVRCVKK